MNFSLYFSDSLTFFYPEFYLSTAVLILFVAEGLGFTKTSYVERNNTFYKCILFVLSLTFFLEVASHGISTAPLMNAIFMQDQGIVWVKSLILGTAFCAIFLVGQEKNASLSYEYFLFFLFVVLGLLFAVSSTDMISVYLALETQALASYVLAAFFRQSAFSTEAGLKYFLLGAVASGLIVMGFALLYLSFGVTTFDDLSAVLYYDRASYATLGLLCLCSGLLFKLGAVPFHMWLPDVYEGSPTPVTAFFAMVPKIGVLFLFTKIFYGSCLEAFATWESFLLVTGFFSVLLGSFSALRQRKLKRLLAFSGIGHVGYMLLSLGTGSLEGLHAAFFYLLVYLLTSSGIWAIVVAGTTRGYVRNLTEFADMIRTNPIVGLSVAILFFSLAGFPPFAGFFSKFYAFFVYLSSSIVGISIVTILIGMVSAFYYLKVGKILCFEKKQRLIPFTLSKEGALVLGLSTFGTVLFFFVSPSFFLLSMKVALSFLFW